MGPTGRDGISRILEGGCATVREQFGKGKLGMNWFECEAYGIAECLFSGVGR